MQIKKRNTLQTALIILVVATIVFIWSNSLQSVSESQARSLSFLDKVKPFLECFAGQGNVTNHVLRKLAHFTEFAALGCGLALLFAICYGMRWKTVIYGAFTAIVVAVTDETIQIFTGRGSQVQDVWLDFAGACAGILFAITVAGIWKTICNRCGRRQVTERKNGK